MAYPRIISTCKTFFHVYARVVTGTFTVFMLLAGMLIFARMPAPLHAEEVPPVHISGSCNNNSVSITFNGITNLDEGLYTETVLGAVRFCDYDFEADFPIPGETVSIGVEATRASTEELHNLDVDLDGWNEQTYDFDTENIACFPPTTIYEDLDGVDIEKCYTESTYPFTSTAALLTWRVVPCEVDEDGMELTSWLAVSVNARRSWCADDPKYCKYY